MKCDKVAACSEALFSGGFMSGCPNDREHCLESSDNRSRVKCEEKGKKYILENTMKNQVLSYKMDGGIILEDSNVPVGINKCDHMLLVKTEKPTVILVELKGTDVKHVMKQISSTVDLFSSLWHKMDHVYGRIAAVSAVPKIHADPDYTKLTGKLLKLGGNLKVEGRIFEESDTELGKKH